MSNVDTDAQPDDQADETDETENEEGQEGEGAEASGEEPKKRGKGRLFTDEQKIFFLEDENGVKYGPENNPKRKGSASRERFAKYVDGMTVAEYIKANDNQGRGDLSWDTQAGFIRIE